MLNPVNLQGVPGENLHPFLSKNVIFKYLTAADKKSYNRLSTKIATT